MREKRLLFHCGYERGTGDFQTSLETLARLVCKCRGKKPVILIDDFDAPLRSGSLHGYYEEARNFLKSLYGSAIRDNASLQFGVLAGVCPDGISGLYGEYSCIKTYTMQDEGFSSCFGFTGDEVRDMLDYYGFGDRYDAVRRWYGGHRCGGTELFSPASEVRYLADGAPVEPRGYVPVSGNGIICAALVPPCGIPRRTSLLPSKPFCRGKL